MMTKLIRPCTLWGETFDACDVSDIMRDDKLENRKKFDFNVALYFLGNPFIIDSPYVQTRKEQDALFQDAITDIYNALNAPVLATEEVLAGLPKDVQFLVYRAWGDPPKENPFQHCNLHPAYLFRKNDKEAYNWYFTDAIIVDKGLRHSPVLGFHIKSNGCPKTAKYLLQFYTDGTPVVVK